MSTKQRIEVMLDLETTDLAETAAILEIAMVPFHLDGSDCMEEHIHEYIDLTSCFLEGMTFSRATQEKWMEWKHSAHGLRNSAKRPVRAVIAETYNWLLALAEKYELHIWCRGKNFDLPKYERCVRTLLEQEEMPYKFWNTEDARDYPHTFGVHSTDIQFEGTPHCAIDDCRHQIKQVQLAYIRQRKMMRYAELGLAFSHKNNPETLRSEFEAMTGKRLSENQMELMLIPTKEPIPPSTAPKKANTGFSVHDD